ncbi:protein of unknown function [Bartonella clarridgeiae 73]|uniref:Uncharacterized protein n=1 Tax=Bartonella clarridgeiae (strain CCUG 45776 / CIP 104772 / 73) TaxID=696125 RepID=E6YFS5_BARC7|nr:MAG: hypothetical protein PG977_001069 [Bartonella clarridgeiae]CBI75713.1 protein of unknown function [Bartonella clarridgeiae 73]
MLIIRIEKLINAWIITVVTSVIMMGNALLVFRILLITDLNIIDF